MGLRLKKEQPKNQIAETASAKSWKHTDFPKPESAVLPPDPTGRSRLSIHENGGIPAVRISAGSGTSENFLTDRKNIRRKVFSGGIPFSLNHVNPPYITKNEWGNKQMDPKKIERINELARKKKAAGLTAEEAAEQAELRKEYLDGYRENLKAMLDNIVVQEKDGSRHPLKRKDRLPGS